MGIVERTPPAATTASAQGSVAAEQVRYHVLVAAMPGCSLFEHDNDFEWFAKALAVVSQRRRIAIVAYCLLKWEYHLLLNATEEQAHKLVEELHRCYDGKRNSRSATIESDKQPESQAALSYRYRVIKVKPLHACTLVRSIHRAPINQKPPLVSRLHQYHWSSYPVYSGRIPPPPWLSPLSI